MKSSEHDISEKHRVLRLNFSLYNHLPEPLQHEKIVTHLLSALDNIADSAKNCKACGSIQPELHLVYGWREFRFVCYEITDTKGNIVAETDYETLEKQCNFVVNNRRKVNSD